jgi:isopentenyl-diphosphate delta-isomerase
MGKYHTPGLWTNTCCTHPEWDETPEDCAVRRLKEELGIRDLVPQHRHNLEYRADVGGGLTEHEVVDVYVAEADSDLDVKPNPGEVMAVDWVRYTDLLTDVERSPARFTPWVRIYLRDHAATIFGELAEASGG